MVDPWRPDHAICRLAATTNEWNCLNLADGPGKDGPTGSGQLAATVGDPISGRVVLIYGYGPGGGGMPYYDRNEVWAINFATGEWTQLLE